MNTRHSYPILAAALVAISLSVVAQPTYAQLSGAIWTTTHNGRVVNGNIYKEKCDVYLNGGPGPNAPIGAAGLPMGWYYFMVTDPSGKELLSDDAITERRIWVNEYGVFAEKVWEVADGGDGRLYPVHVYNDDKGEKDGFGAIVVQLCPYLDTPNNGGVYKAWVTPVNMYQEGEGKHGFIPRWSKTDNFKVGKRPPDQWLYVYKFKDCNANGVWDDTEVPLQWDVTIDPPEGESWIEQTPATIMAWPGEWNVTEILEPGWIQTALIIDDVDQEVSSTATVTFGDKDETHTVVFGNIPTGRIVACKFYDSDVDEYWDEGEPGIPCVKMTLTGRDVLADPLVPGDNVTRVGYTGPDGCVAFDGLLPGTYVVSETPPTNCDWVSTTPTVSGPIALPCEEGAEERVSFGNIITGTACFSTKGYWHNKNGLGEIKDDDIAYVNTLAPYSSASSYFEDGDEPFDGLFDDGTLVASAYNNEKITDGIAAGEGTARAEISHFLVERNPDDSPDQLAQQLLAFIFNVRRRLGGEGAVILEPGLWEGSAESLIDEAIAAWSGSDSSAWNGYASILDQLNNRECSPGVKYVFPLPPDSCMPICPPE